MLWLSFLLVGFFLTRLYHLTLMPPFLDELTYIHWLNAINFRGDWLIPLKSFGWEPLQIWTAALLNRLVSDPLLSLRLNSVLISVAALILIYKLAGKAAAIFYLLSPLILLHDRIGLRGDNLVILAGLIVYYGLRQKAAIWWGLGIALGLFAKTTAAALPVVVIVSYLWFRPKLKWSDFAGVLLAGLPLLFYFLTGTLNLVVAKESTFIGGLSIRNNLLQIGPWLYQYLTWPVALLVIVGFFVSLKNRLLIINGLIPLLLLIVSAKILFPRYLLPAMPFLMIYAASGFSWLGGHLPKLLRPLLLVFLIVPAWFCGQILKDVAGAPLPEIDGWQYISGWPSGYGVKDMADYLRANPPPLLVAQNDDLIKNGLDYYWPGNGLSFTQTATSGAYLVANINEQLPEGFRPELIKEFPRPGNKSSIKLWRLE